MSGVLDSGAKSGLAGVLRSCSARPNEIRRTGHEAGAQIAPSSGSLRVLVVDDNPVNLMVMSALLEWRGIGPVLVGDGVEAVTLACEMHFDLILMDLEMPVLDGRGATLAIRRFETGRSRAAVPVVAYSSSCPGWERTGSPRFQWQPRQAVRIPRTGRLFSPVVPDLSLSRFSRCCRTDPGPGEVS